MASGGRAGWGELLGRIGRSAVELWRAELQTLSGELGDTGRVLLRALLLAAIAGFLAFWALGLALSGAVAALALVLPVWAAAGSVFLLAAGGAAVVGLLARSRFRSLESPVRTVKRRVGDHVTWWQEQLLPPEDSGDGDRGSSLRRPAEGRSEVGDAGVGPDDSYGDDDPYLVSSSRRVDEEPPPEGPVDDREEPRR
ncbi:MAG TPA: phage holin family protein [Thermoanaerobaculia bacterium]|nr:phage holin family protein [Thermoanaerobaculia bacterium]